jgi:hypothetical protein
MDELQRPSPKEFVVSKEIGTYDEQMTSNMVMGELVAAIRGHFGMEKTPATEATEDQPAVGEVLTMRVVCLTPEDFEEFQELQLRVKDLEAELDSERDETVITDET